MSTVTQRRVARALRPGGPEVIEVGVEDLTSPKAGEVLVRIEAAGLNHAETLICSGNYTVRLPFPYAVGGEGSGTVVATGPEVTVPLGTWVCWGAILGSCATFITAPASMLVPIPDGLSFEDGACLAVAGLTAGGLARVWPLEGHAAVVWGAAGAVGRMLVAILADRRVEAIGIDGGFVRAAHKAGFFEVIAGKSVVEFRRDDQEQTPSSKCFSFVQTFDEKPRRRLWELLKSQGMAENQQVVFLSDGGDSVRQLQEYIHPFSEHWIDWFHITMRITVLQQQIKGLQDEQPDLGQDAARGLDKIKHFLWHGNTFQALQRLEGLLMDLGFPEIPSELTRKVAKAAGEFEAYIRNNEEFIPNFGERRRNGERISTAFVESTVNQVVSKRMVKKQQMQWTPRGAHLLLQIRTKVLNNELEDVFRRWYPQFRAASASAPAF